MLPQTLLEEPHITIAYDPDQHWLVADWQGHQNMATVQQGGLALLRLLKECDCHKILNVNTNVTGMWSEAAEWGGTEWFPTMMAAGLQHFAWVYSPNIYSRLSTDLMLQLAPRDVAVGTFDDVATASAWLAQA